MRRELSRRASLGVAVAAFAAGAAVAFVMLHGPAQAPAQPQFGEAQFGNRPVTTTGLFLTNEKGETRASLTLWDGEHPALILADKQCERRAALIVSPHEQASLTLFGEDCKRRAALEIQPDDEPAFILRDHNDVPRARIHLLTTGSPRVYLYDDRGAKLWEAP